MKKTTVLLTLAMTLGGCAAPPVLTVASLLADAFSFAFTEKSVSDHGISFAAQRDCAMWRVFTEGTPCREDGPAILVAGLTDRPQTDAVIEHAALPAIETPRDTEPTVLAAIVTAAGETDTALAQRTVSDVEPAVPAVVEPAKPAVAPARKRGNSYFVIASFNTEKDARNLVRRHKGLSPQVISAHVEGDRKYRVVVGPFNDRGRETVRRRIASAGIERPWMMAASR